MSFFSRKSEYPKLPGGDYDVILRCSICNGEEVVCLKDRHTGELRELMLVKSPNDLQEFCEANAISPDSIKKVY